MLLGISKLLALKLNKPRSSCIRFNTLVLSISAFLFYLSLDVILYMFRCHLIKYSLCIRVLESCRPVGEILRALESLTRPGACTRQSAYQLPFRPCTIYYVVFTSLVNYDVHSVVRITGYWHYPGYDGY